MRSIAATAATTLAAASLFLPLSVSAQQPLQPVRVVEKDNSVRADALHAAALRLDDEPARYGKAAGMHMRSAEMRAATDAQAVRCMVRAGFLLYYAGDLEGAQQALTDAAERAAALGDVVTEAMSYVDAGYVAQELRHPLEAVALGKRAQVLAASPLLTAAQRASITDRLQFAESSAGGATVASLRAAPATPR